MSGTSSTSGTSSVGVIAAVVVVGAVSGLYLSGVVAQDLGVFLHAARRLLAGADPYASVGSARFESGHGFVYPWVVGWLVAPLAPLGRQAATAVFDGASFAAIAAAMALLGRRRPLDFALIVVASTTVIAIQMGTLNPLLLFGVAVAWRLRDRALPAGLAVAAVIVAKLFLLPVLAWLVLSGRYKAAGVAAAGTAGGLLAGFVLGPLSAPAYVSMLERLSAHESGAGWSLTALGRGIGLGPAGASGLAAVAAGGVLLAAWRRRRRGAGEELLLAAGVLASLLVTPILWSSYLLLAVVPLALAGGAGELGGAGGVGELGGVGGVGGAGGSLGFAAYAAVSWMLVTPDSASLPEVIAGIALAATLVAAAAGPASCRAALSVAAQRTAQRAASGRRRAASGRRRGWKPAAGVTGGAGLVGLAVLSPALGAQAACVAALAGVTALSLHSARR